MRWAADPFNFGSNPDLGLRIPMYRKKRKYFELLVLKISEDPQKSTKIL